GWHRWAEGPRSRCEGGARTLFTTRRSAVTVECVGRDRPFRDTASSSAEVNRQLAACVRRAVEADQLPFVVAGSCNACLGVLGGFEHGRCGAVWLDAHADF